jgi:DNA end-binding protein Ku
MKIDNRGIPAVMRPTWKGAISFGLVSIPVKLYAATETHDVSFRQVHAADGGRIRYRRFCEIDDAEVPYSDIAKGYELPDGDMVVLSDEDMEKLPLSTSKAVDVLEFVPVEQVDPLMFGRAYYAQAEASASKPYVLMRDTLADSGRLAIVKIALRTRESLAVLRPYGELMIIQTLLWPEEVREPVGLAPDENVTVRKQELAMASSYIETLAGDFDPDVYTDDYRAAVEELVAAKAAGREVAPAPTREGGEIIDLVEALRASVQDAKERRGTRETGAKKAPAKKKAAAKKSAPKKAASKKTAAKKTSGRRKSA